MTIWLLLCAVLLTLTWERSLAIKSGFNEDIFGCDELLKISVMMFHVVWRKHLRCNEIFETFSARARNTIPHFRWLGQYVRYTWEIIVLDVKLKKGKCTSDVVHRTAHSWYILDESEKSHSVNSVYVPARLTLHVLRQFLAFFSCKKVFTALCFDE